ncbi:hypothetical protein HMPREF1395_00238 [Helicobacter pylori GAM112Ai]|nr:hypothetical protein HMPREF1395_00238 [Helicobacter pylori GAM112Ai]EMH33046.1 hypothetical protein HMPREF1424_00818 [Helicobacter pylori GAM42Ai]
MSKTTLNILKSLNSKPNALSSIDCFKASIFSNAKGGDFYPHFF